MIFTTELTATDPTDNQLKRWAGQNIEARSWIEAEEYCRNNCGYLQVTGMFICELPVTDTEFENIITYQQNNN